jgi:hypothetical protein
VEIPQGDPVEVFEAFPLQAFGFDDFCPLPFEPV